MKYICPKYSQTRSKPFRLVYFLFLFLGAALGSALADESEYRILVTNDDGIEAAGLAALVLELKKSATVVVSAPASQQSGRSTATSWGFKAGEKKGTFESKSPIKASKFRRDDQFFGLAVEGSPADAVSIGIKFFQTEASQRVGHRNQRGNSVP